MRSQNKNNNKLKLNVNKIKSKNNNIANNNDEVTESLEGESRIFCRWDTTASRLAIVSNIPDERSGIFLDVARHPLAVHKNKQHTASHREGPLAA